MAPKMAKLVLPLTEAKVKNAKPREKAYKPSDGGGLYLEVTPAGSKLWRMGYTQDIDVRLTSVKQHPIAKKPPLDRGRSGRRGTMRPAAPVVGSQRLRAGCAVLSHARQRHGGHSKPPGGQDATNGSEFSHDQFEAHFRCETVGEREDAARARIEVAKATQAPGNATFRSRPCNAA
jgi:hypothetical protein